MATIAATWNRRGVLIDPHTADGVGVAVRFTEPGVPMIVLETALPVHVEKLQDYFVRRGVWLRPFGRLIYAMPPYVISDQDLDRLVRAMRGAAEEGQWE